MFYVAHNRTGTGDVKRGEKKKEDEYMSEFLWGRPIRTNYIKHESLISN